MHIKQQAKRYGWAYHNLPHSVNRLLWGAPRAAEYTRHPLPGARTTSPSRARGAVLRFPDRTAFWSVSRVVRTRCRQWSYCCPGYCLFCRRLVESGCGTSVWGLWEAWRRCGEGRESQT